MFSRNAVNSREKRLVSSSADSQPTRTHIHSWTLEHTRCCECTDRAPYPASCKLRLSNRIDGQDLRSAVLPPLGFGLPRSGAASPAFFRLRASRQRPRPDRLLGIVSSRLGSNFRHETRRCGARPTKTFWKIASPNIRPDIGYRAAAIPTRLLYHTRFPSASDVSLASLPRLSAI